MTKKLLGGLFLLVGVIISSTLWVTRTTAQVEVTTSFTDVIEWMHTVWLTKYNSVEEFRPFDSITRWEAAKFVAQYARLAVLPKDYLQCEFNDIQWYDSTLTPHIKQACYYGLMKWSNGQYRPEWLITEAEAITVVMRSVYGFFEETADPWYIAYYNRWEALWLITDETLDSVGTTNISREKLGTRLYQANLLNTPEWEFYSTNPGQAHYQKYTKQKFDDAIASGKQVAMFFHLKSCPLCHGMRDIINDGIADGDIPSDVRIYEVDFEDSDEFKQAYNVKGQTTFVFFDSEGNDIETTRSIFGIDQLLERFE